MIKLSVAIAPKRENCVVFVVEYFRVVENCREAKLAAKHATVPPGNPSVITITWPFVVFAVIVFIASFAARFSSPTLKNIAYGSTVVFMGQSC